MGIGRFNLVGQQKPREVVDALIASEEAWDKYSLAVDEYIDKRITNEQRLDYLKAAATKEREYYRLSREWHHQVRQ